MKIREVHNGFETYIQCEFENDVERDIFYNKCGKVYLVQFVNDYKIILKEVNE